MSNNKLKSKVELNCNLIECDNSCLKFQLEKKEKDEEKKKKEILSIGIVSRYFFIDYFLVFDIILILNELII
jgi:hypothetical protein